MADIIVAPGGDDGTGDGSPEAPYASLRAALDAAGPQGTVIASDGTYDYLIFAAGDAGASGTPTTLKAANKWGARIVPSAGYHGINMQAGANWITVDGFDVSGTATDRDGIKCDGDDCVITNCRIHDCGQNGVLASGARVTVSSCLIYSNGTDALDHGIYSSSVGATYKANVVRVNTGYGLHLYGVSGVTGVDVYNNVSYGNGTSAILVQGPGGGEAACDNVINNNYFETPSAKTAQAVAIRACNTAIFANNIVVAGTGYAVQESEGTVSTIFDRNIFYPHSVNQDTHGDAGKLEQLTNGNFETVSGNDFADWTEAPTGGSTITDDGANAHTGSHCVKMHVESGASVYIRQAAVMTVGVRYRLTFWAKASEAVGLRLDSPSTEFAITTAYQMFTAVFVADNTQLTLIRNTSSTHDIWIDDVSLREELLVNGDFETVSTNDFGTWTETPSGSSTVTDDGANAHSGSHCPKLHVVSGASVYIRQASVMTVGRVYTLEFWAKASATVGMSLDSPSIAFTLTTTYQRFIATFVATSTSLTLVRGSGGDYDIWIDDVSLRKAYGPDVHGIEVNGYWPRWTSRAIAGGTNLYKPATDFWGNTPPATVQVGPVPYTEHLHPRTMLHDPWNLTNVNRRWWNWRLREQKLIPG